MDDAAASLPSDAVVVASQSVEETISVLPPPPVAPVADGAEAPAPAARTIARVRPPVQPVAQPSPQPAAAPAQRKAAAPAGKGQGKNTKIVQNADTLDEVMAQVSAIHGPNVLRRATESLMVLPHYPTNILTLDMGLMGGIVQSGMTMIYGWQSAGKTTVLIRAVASAQAKYPDKKAVIIDQEGTLDAIWAQAHGIDIERLVIAQPEYGEQAVDVMEAVIRARDTSIVALDSIPALVPMKELEDSAEDAQMALQARLIGKAVRKGTQAILDERKRQHYPAVVFINQWRNRMTMMGDPRTLPGGNAPKFFMHTMFEVMSKEVMGKDANGAEVADYNEHSFKITKCKEGSSLKTGAWEMIRNPDNPLGQGFIDEGETVLSFAKKFGFFTGGGSSWRLDTVDLKFNRHTEVVQYLYENDDEMLSLKNRIISAQRARLGLRATDW